MAPCGEVRRLVLGAVSERLGGLIHVVDGVSELVCIRVGGVGHLPFIAIHGLHLLFRCNFLLNPPQA